MRLLVSGAQTDFPRATHHRVIIFRTLAGLLFNLMAVWVLQILATAWDESAQLGHAFPLDMQSQARLLTSLIMVSIQDGWSVSWVSQVAEGLFEILSAIIHIVIIQFKLADEMDFLFHEFCLNLVSLNQGLFLMMTE